MTSTSTTQQAPKSTSAIKAFGRGFLRLPPSVYVIACLVAVSFAIVPVLTKLPFQMVILRQAAPVGLVICAQLSVMRANSIDLSVGGVFILMNCLVTSSAFSGLPEIFSLFLPVMVAIMVGAINGYFIAVLRSSSVVVTLAMGSILLGVVLYLSSGRPPGSAGDWSNGWVSENSASSRWRPLSGLLWPLCWRFICAKASTADTFGS